jgi:hypothetical protein
MLDQLLWIESVLKAASGLALVAAPGVIIRLLGLAPSAGGFWPRLLGTTLLGMALATTLQARAINASGLGLAGSVAINLTVAVMIIALLILGQAAPTRRGRITLAFASALLVLLSLVEIAHAA